MMNKYRLIIDTSFPSKTIISYGLVIYSKNTKKIAIIQRQHTIEFLLIIKGTYRLAYLPLFVSKIVPEEAKVLRSIITDLSLLQDLFLNKLHLQPNDLNYSLLRLKQNKIFILKLLDKLDITKNKLPWTFPKGRLQITSTNTKELPLDCAKRESSEELEIILPEPLFVSNNYFTDVFKTTTGLIIESRYWLYIIPNEITLSQPLSHIEVSNRMWTDVETCQSLIGNNISDFINSIID